MDNSKPVDPSNPPYCICEDEGICRWCEEHPDSPGAVRYRALSAAAPDTDPTPED